MIKFISRIFNKFQATGTSLEIQTIKYSPNFQKYLSMMHKLRKARAMNDLFTEDSIEESMIQLWNELSPEEKLLADSLAREAFP